MSCSKSQEVVPSFIQAVSVVGGKAHGVVAVSIRRVINILATWCPALRRCYAIQSKWCSGSEVEMVGEVTDECR